MPLLNASRDLAQRLTGVADSGRKVVRHRGVVQGINADGTTDITLDGSTYVLTNISTLVSAEVSVNDTVEVLVDESDVIVIGRIADSLPIPHDHDADYSALGHTHDTRYYTETEVNTLLAGKAPSSHTHSYLPLSGGTITGTLNMNGYTNYQTPGGGNGHIVHSSGHQYITADGNVYIRHYSGGSYTTSIVFNIGSILSYVSFRVDPQDLRVGNHGTNLHGDSSGANGMSWLGFLALARPNTQVVQNQSNGGYGTQTSYRRSGTEQGRVYMYSTGEVIFQNISTRARKRDIATREHRGIAAKVAALRTVDFRYDNAPDDSPKAAGFIAEEVQEIAPYAVSEGTDLETGEPDGVLGLAYGKLSVLAIEAIHDIVDRLDELESRVPARP